MATLADLWEAPATKTGNPTKEQILGRSDLSTHVQGLQATLADTVPGSPTHQRITQSIAEAQKELGTQPQPAQPAQPTGSSFADLWEATPAYVKPTEAPATQFRTGRADTMMEGDLASQIPDIAKQVAQDAGTFPNEAALNSGKWMAEVPRTAVQNVLAKILSGYAGVAGAVLPGEPGQGARYQQQVEKALSYEPTSETSKGILKVLGAPGEYVISPLAEKAGATIAEAGYPATGAIVKGGIEAAPYALGLLGKKAPPGVQSIVAPGVDASALTAVRRAEIAAQNAGIMSPQAVAEMQAQFASKRPAASVVPVAPIAAAGSLGAAAVPDETMVRQALSVASPELQQALSGKKFDQSFQRHIEADSLPVKVHLTEGQATGDVVRLSNEQNRRGRDPELAQRFNEQNGQLTENLNKIRETAAPDAYGTKTIENSQGVIDAYKALDTKLNEGINAKYQALRDAAGGQFPVDAPMLMKNVQAKLQKELLSNEAPAGQLKELQRLADNNNMTFEDYLSMRRNLGDVARTSTDGPTRKAAGYMIEELEKLPLQQSAQNLKPLADQARTAARNRFQMLEKDPAYKAAVDDAVPADKFIQKFVVNGVNKNIQTMVKHLGKDSEAHQHMAAGTVNWLKDKAGIVDETGNFTQAGYNKALKQLDDVKNLNEIFNPEAASQLKTLGNVARYTQAQPRGAFVNNSNTLVGSMAQRAGTLAEHGANAIVPGLQLGTSIKEMRARRAAEKETQKALEPGAGTTKINQLGQ